VEKADVVLRRLQIDLLCLIEAVELHDSARRR
jgi:hypothetical protein